MSIFNTSSVNLAVGYKVKYKVQWVQAGSPCSALRFMLKLWRGKPTTNKQKYCKEI